MKLFFAYLKEHARLIVALVLAFAVFAVSFALYELPLSALAYPAALCLVPALAFDLKLNRMGFGKGYYDKLLSDFCGVKIGLCYDFQITDTVFPEAHDVPMNIIITEKRIINAF